MGRLQVAVIGAGFSGTMVAVHLLRLARSSAVPIDVTLYEPSGDPGRGRAYATQSPIHLLNVTAGRMSAFADDADHFLRWAKERDESVSAGSFLPRRLYGEYLSEILNGELRASEERFQLVPDEVLDITLSRESQVLRLRSGSTRSATHVVLATGHPLPAPPVAIGREVQSSGRYRDNPWGDEALDPIPASGELLLIGSGLTAVDVMLEARRRGFQGMIHFLSRHGLLPLPHDPAGWSQPPVTYELRENQVLAMVRSLRQEARRAEGRGESWRAYVDSLRPRTQDLWRSLNLRERKRFLRHPRAYWEVHRHRIAPEIESKVRREIDAGGLKRHAARVLSIESKAAGLRVAVLPRGSREIGHLVVELVINCTGPNTGIEMCQSPLTQTLLKTGACRPDDLGIGLACDAEGALIPAKGSVSGNFFTLGPLRKGELWESTAVPELRVQAERLARRLLGDTRPV